MKISVSIFLSEAIENFQIPLINKEISGILSYDKFNEITVALNVNFQLYCLD